jgi:hypothetical protein
MELNCSPAPTDFERYRPIGSAIPLRRRTGLEVFPFAIRASAVESASNAQAPANLLSPSEFDRNRPLPDQPVAALLGFWPFQRFQPWKPGYLGLTAPDTFRLQGFAPSCRFASSTAFRPYFMPVTLLGFSFRAFPPRRAFGPSRNRLPSWCWCCNHAAPELPLAHQAREPHLQGFAPCEDSPPRAVGLATHQRPLPSWFSDL